MATVTQLHPTNLRELLAAIRAGRYDGGRAEWRWAEFPTFGGDEPASTSGVWSWDATHLLVGTCKDDMRIVPRAVH